MIIPLPFRAPFRSQHILLFFLLYAIINCISFTTRLYTSGWGSFHMQPISCISFSWILNFTWFTFKFNKVWYKQRAEWFSFTQGAVWKRCLLRAAAPAMCPSRDPGQAPAETHPFRSTVCHLLIHTDSCSVPPSCCTSWDVGRAFQTSLSHTRSGHRNTCRGLWSNHRAGKEKEMVNIWLVEVLKEEIRKPPVLVSCLANTLSLYA